MKKGWKIGLIAAGSLLGLVVAVVAVAMWIVFTPSQLTKVVNSLAGRFVNAETHFGRVDLTLFRTFPDAGLEVRDVYVVNPTAGAPSDTVARIGSLTVGLDVKRFLKANEVVVHQVLLDNVQANLYIAADGHSNFDIFPTSADEDDTTSAPFSLDSLPMMNLRKIRLHGLGASLLNEQGGMVAAAEGVDVDVDGSLGEGLVDATVKVDGRRLAVDMHDSTGAPTLAAVVEKVGLGLKGRGSMEEVDACLALNVKKGQLKVGETEMVNSELQAARHDLLAVELPCRVDLKQMALYINEDEQARVRLADYGLTLGGRAQLASGDEPMAVDASVRTDGSWQVGEVLKIVPQQFTSALAGMDVDAKVSLEATAAGTLTDSTMPVVDARVALAEGRFYYPKALPYRLRGIGGDVEAHLDLGKGGVSHAVVHRLSASTLGTTLNVSGRADDLTGDMRVDATVKGQLPLADAMPMVPDSLHLTADGTAAIDAKACFRLSDVQRMDLERMKADVKLNLKQLDVRMDSLHATSPALDVALTLPARVHSGRLADATVKGNGLKVEMPGMNGSLDRPDISLGVNNPLKEQLAASFDITVGETEANTEEMTASLGGLALKGTVRMDSTQSNPLRKFNPEADVDMHSAVFYMNSLPDALRMQQFNLQYGHRTCRLSTAELRVGHSDFQLSGTVDNLEDWLDHKAMLKGDVEFTSNYADVDQLMDLFSGMGSDADSLEQMRKEDNVPDEANPFIVPRDVDLTLHTHIKRSVAFGNDLNDVAGTVTIKDGVAVLDQIGFVCKAATMQLTALYKSPRPSNLFCALDFHLLDIQVDELIDMIPAIDTLVPMLAALEGKANFHLAAETFLDARYQPKMSSLLGSAAISGRNLTVMDNSTISQVAKLMQLKSWKEKDDKIKVDSIDVELTCFRKEIEVYPFLLNIGKYSLCASGKHTLDNQCGYHVELLKNPLLAKVGVDVRGDIAHPKVSLGSVRYADLYKPEKQGVVEKRTLELKRMIKEALEANVR